MRGPNLSVVNLGLPILLDQVPCGVGDPGLAPSGVGDGGEGQIGGRSNPRRDLSKAVVRVSRKVGTCGIEGGDVVCASFRVSEPGASASRALAKAGMFRVVA